MNLVKRCPTCHKLNPHPGSIDCTVCETPLSSIVAMVEPVATPDAANIPQESSAAHGGRQFCVCDTSAPKVSGYCGICFRPLASSEVSSPSLSATQATLTLEEGGSSFVCNLPCVIGRDSTTLPRELRDILKTQFSGVSERHCVLLAMGDQLEVIDLKSTNGTFVCLDGNWARIEPATRTLVGSPNSLRLGQRCLLQVKL